MVAQGEGQTGIFLVRSQLKPLRFFPFHEQRKRPIGLKFGAKTPAELAIAIVAELIDVRYRARYSQEARDKHDQSLGR